MAPVVNVLDVLHVTRQEAQRNAAVLDHISAPHHPQHQNHYSISQPFTSAASQLQSNSEQTHSKKQPSSASGESLQRKSGYPKSAKGTSRQNSTPGDGDQDLETGKTQNGNETSSPPQSAPPISKYVLSSLFAAVDRLTSLPKGERGPNYAFIENDQEDHFLYALILPLIARLLAVSCPGILCVVQIPRQDVQSYWAPPSCGGYGFNGSFGSKSVGHTTPSPQETSRTPSPSDEEVGSGNRKSISPDSNPGTAELIRHADKILSGAEAAAEKRATEARVNGECSPPPESSAHDHRTLRLICNGFEVLTGKMPPARYNMGSFTMASVGWEKAGVVSPEDAARAVPMSFSNGMVTPTEGIVVTFSNGSMCFLTLRDPPSVVESLNISDATPVVAFSFSCAGQLSLSSLLHQDSSSLSPEAERVRTTCERGNIFFVEIGRADCASKNDSNGPDDAPKWLQQRAASSDISTRKEVAKAAKREDQNANSAIAFPRCPPVVITAVPRAVPLFVNTINQTFIDGPYYEVPENAYENELINDRYRNMRHEADLRRTNRMRETSREERKAPDGNENLPQSTPELKAPQNAISNPVPSDAQAGLKKDAGLQGATTYVSGVTARAGAVVGLPQIQAVATLSERPAPVCGRVGVPPNYEGNQRPSSAYSYYSGGQGPGYPRNNSHGHPTHPSRPMVGLPVGLHQGHSQLNGSHAGYYHPVRATAPAPNGQGHYHAQPGGSYPTQPYYPLPHPSMMHQSAQNSGQWHPGAPSISQGHGPLPPPHPMDARRDMPVHFSSHRAVTSLHRQYASQYYACPSQTGQSYDSRQNGMNARRGMYTEAPQPGAEPQGPNYTTGLSSTGVNRIPKIHDIRGTPTPDRVRPMPAVAANARDAGSDGNDIPRITHEGEWGTVASGNETLATDKENALRALIQMREGVQDEGGKRQEKRRRCGTESIGQPRGGPEYSTRGRSNDSPNTASEACNIREDGGVTAGVKSPVNARFLGRSRSRLSTATNSPTSTNSHSQGRPLSHAAVIGNAHNPSHQGYAGTQPQCKRSRQR